MKLPYDEGDICCFPLPSGEFALGVVARKNKGGRVLLGYFFGLRLSKCPDNRSVPALGPAQSIRILRFGDLGLMNGEWKIVGRIAEWDRDDWPFPTFVRKDTIIGRNFLVKYPDDEPNGDPSSEPTDSNVDAYEEDGMHGYGAVELVIDDLLTKDSNVQQRSDNSNLLEQRSLSESLSIDHDLMAIQANRRAGGNPFARTELTFRFYLATQSSAKMFANAAQDLGCSAAIRAPWPGDESADNVWLVEIIQSNFLTPETIETYSQVLETLGLPFGADFDGWEASVTE